MLHSTSAPLYDRDRYENREDLHEEALKSVARWVMRDDLSVERRLAAIRRVCHEALSNG